MGKRSACEGRTGRQRGPAVAAQEGARARRAVAAGLPEGGGGLARAHAQLKLAHADPAAVLHQDGAVSGAAWRSAHPGPVRSSAAGRARPSSRAARAFEWYVTRSREGGVPCGSIQRTFSGAPTRRTGAACLRRAKRLTACICAAQGRCPRPVSTFKLASELGSSSNSDARRA